jgi:RNA-splicing ligase RtcB
MIWLHHFAGWRLVKICGAEEAPSAYKDVEEVAAVAEATGLSRRVARVLPIACVKG